MNRRAAFTLIELLIVMAILGVLVTMLVPVITGQIEEARRKSCQANLHAIGQKMIEYAHGHNGKLPATLTGPPNKGDHVGSYRGEEVPAAGATRGGNSRNMWLLIREDYLDKTVYICPSSGHRPDPTDAIGNYYDFGTESDTTRTNHEHLSYSLHVQKTSDNGSDFFPLSLLSSGGKAIAADRTPISGVDSWVHSAWGGTLPKVEVDTPEGGVDEADNNSFNHDQDGQNVVFMDGHAAWFETPNVGVNQDNIWTWSNAANPNGSTGVKAGASQFRFCTPGRESDSFLFP